MKIARTQIDGKLQWIGSDDGERFFRLKGCPLDSELALDTGSPVSVAMDQLAVPIDPPQIIAIGLNYKEHAKEFNNPIPEFPVVFFKSITSTLSHLGTIEIPKAANATFVDYEVEMAIVIGKRTKNVSESDAMDSVLGYTIANDVSSRDWQKGKKGGGQWCRAKSFDTFCPLGPWIVSKDEIPDPDNLRVQSEVNGELRQQSNTSDMIFPVAHLISFLSKSMTLLPGAVILTGTPCGVGAAMDPRQRLSPGDEVKLTIEKIGELKNIVGDELV